mgnify:CR=1 FL=1
MNCLLRDIPILIRLTIYKYLHYEEFDTYAGSLSRVFQTGRNANLYYNVFDRERFISKARKFRGDFWHGKLSSVGCNGHPFRRFLARGKDGISAGVTQHLRMAEGIRHEDTD